MKHFDTLIVFPRSTTQVAVSPTPPLSPGETGRRWYLGYRQSHPTDTHQTHQAPAGTQRQGQTALGREGRQ